VVVTYADCFAILGNAVMGTSVVTRILPVTQLILLVVKLPRSLASTSKTMEIANMVTTADSLTKVMPQKNQLQTVLLAMLEVVAAVEEEGEEDVDVAEVEVVGEVDVVVVYRHPQRRLLPVLLVSPLLPMLLPKRRMRVRSK